jgi:PTS system beta-glucosides-specific IIC component
MSQKYAPLATRIIELVGGPQNIKSAFHCQTRVRFGLADESKADRTALEATDGVAKALFSGGMFQVVVGTHVADVFDEIEAQLAAVGHRPSAGDDAAKTKRNPVETAIDFISGSFAPIIPALSGAGMVKALLALLVAFNVVSTKAPTYTVLNFFADAVFYFLPILLAFAAANKLKCSPVLAAATAGIMLHPTWASLVAAKAPVSLFDVIPLTLTTYGSTVIPILLVIAVQSYVERFLNKIIPSSLKLVFVPMLLILIMGTLAMSLLGPIGAFLGGYLYTFFLFLSTNAPWVPSLLIGALLPVMVMFGVHYAVGPLGIAQMASPLHYDSIFGPGALVSNIAQGVAGLVVAFRTKDPKLKEIATAGGITGLMGITEPILYGVNLPKKYPLIAAMVGGGAGGLYAGITQTHRFATGSSGLPAVVMYIGGPGNPFQQMINIIIAWVIAIVVTAVVTFVLSFKFEKAVVAPAAIAAEALSLATDSDGAPVVHEGLAEITSPCAGTIVPLSQVADPVFASEAMGPGVAVEPSDGTIVAPCGGTVIVAMKTGHAFGIRTDSGVEVLVHIGIDTVTMKGEGFHNALAKGSRVAAGEPLVVADLAAIKAAGHPASVILAITNHAKVGKVTTTASGEVLAGEPILTVAP